VADLDGDGNLDVLVPNSGPDLRTLTILRGDGKGGLSPATGSPMTLDGGPFFVAVGDLNGDGRPDAVVSHNNDDGVTVLVNQGQGVLRPTPHSPLKLGHNAWGLALADIDADGNLDLLAASDTAVRVFTGDGHGEFAPAGGSPFPAPKGTWRVSLGDVNGDHKLDVVARGVEEDRLLLLLGR
jgi:hypothetical protein